MGASSTPAATTAATSTATTATTTAVSNSSMYSNLFLGVSGITQGFMQAGAARQQGEYERSVYETNAEFARMQAADIRKRADEDAAKYKRKVQGLLGSQRAALAAQGVDVSAMGTSSAQIQEETLQFGYEDAQTIKNNAFREAMGLETESKQMKIQGRFAAAQGRFSSRMSLIGAGLQGFGYGYSAYKDFRADNKKVGE